jgi:GNAT superfamily N-acetyltransferase
MSTNHPIDVHQHEERFQTKLPLTTMLMVQNRLISTEDSEITVRNADPRDYQNIKVLQHQHFIGTLVESDRRDGFLSAEMTDEQIDSIAKDPGIVVAYDVEDLLGFFCVSRLYQWVGSPIVEALLASLSQRSADGRSFDLGASCLFGPMCVTPSRRGTGVLSEMYQHAVQFAGQRFATAIAFISVENPRSLAAVSKLGWSPRPRFLCNGREYYAFCHSLAS